MLFNVYNNSVGTTIFIRLSNKCSSNCPHCELPYLTYNKYYDIINLWKILNFCNKNIDGFTIGILWYNLLDFKRLYEILSRYKNFIFWIQINLNDILLRNKEIIKYSNNNIKFWLQEILKLKDRKKIILLLDIIDKNNLSLQVNFIVKFKEFKRILFLYKSKFKSKVFKERIIFYIWNSIIEFEDDLGIWNISEFWFNYCIAKNNFYLENQKIFIKDDIEIKLNWDIKFHLNNFCNQAIEKISNINKCDNEIYKDFLRLFNILKNRKSWENMCIECLKNKILI